MKCNSNQEFLTLYQPIHSQFTRYCSSRAFGIMEGADLVNETILATLKRFPKIKKKNQLRSFMISTANNILKNQLRRKKFKGQCEEAAFQQLEAKTQNPETALAIGELYQALKQLPEKVSEAIILFEISGFTMKEVSEIQKSSLSATKTRISRGRKTLKQILSEEIPIASII